MALRPIERSSNRDADRDRVPASRSSYFYRRIDAFGQGWKRLCEGTCAIGWQGRAMENLATSRAFDDRRLRAANIDPDNCPSVSHANVAGTGRSRPVVMDGRDPE